MDEDYNQTPQVVSIIVGACVLISYGRSLKEEEVESEEEGEDLSQDSLAAAIQYQVLSLLTCSTII